MLILPLVPDTKQGDDVLVKWKADVEARLKLRPTVDPGAAVTGLGQIKSEAERTRVAAEGVFAKLNVQAVVSALGPLKDIISQTGTELFGLEQETTTAIASTADLAAKGAQLGAAFGPVGSIIGGVSGALLGLVKSADVASPALKELAGDTWGLGMVGVGARASLDNLTGSTSELDRMNKIYATHLVETIKLMKDAAAATREWGTDEEELAVTLGTIAKDKEKNSRAAEEASRRRVAAINAETAALLERKDAESYLDSAGTGNGQDDAERAAEIRQQMAEDDAARMVTREKDLQATLTTLREEAARASLASQQAYALQEQMIFDQRNAQLQAYGAGAQSVLSSIGGAIENNIANEQRLLAGVGAAAEGALGAYLKTKAREFLVAGLGEVAAGWAALGSVALAPTAPLHFYSAAQYGVAAAAAGGAGIALSGDAGRRQGARDEGSAGGGGGGGASTAGRISDPGPTASMTPIVINFQSTVPHTEREQQEAASRIQALLDKRRRR